MRDKELVMEVLRQIEEAAAKIAARFQAIHKVSDFTDSPAGVDKMDAICMMLIVIGESLKNLDKITGAKLLPRYREVDWKKAKGNRVVSISPPFVGKTSVRQMLRRYVDLAIGNLKLDNLGARFF